MPDGRLQNKPAEHGRMFSEQASRTWAGALGKSGTAAVLEHKFYPDSQASANVDVTDEGRPAFSQSICPCPTDGFRTSPPNTDGFKYE